MIALGFNLYGKSISLVYNSRVKLCGTVEVRI